jgi:histidinol phosphatase-like PHP family hydrolase
VLFGIEADCDRRGSLILPENDRSKFDYIIGAIHRLPGLTDPASPDTPVQDAFLFLTEKLLEQNIAALAHPFRVFKRSGRPVPPELFKPTARLLQKSSTAAEINFHTNSPPVEFITECLRYGVKFTFASDAHHLAEIGDFAYHLALLKEAGYDGPLSAITALPSP